MSYRKFWNERCAELIKSQPNWINGRKPELWVATENGKRLPKPEVVNEFADIEAQLLDSESEAQHEAYMAQEYLREN